VFSPTNFTRGFHLYLFGTTLRGAAQMNGVDFTLADKLKIKGLTQ
jgi:isopropylmalate/homocitrate/citramalate synthase